MVNSPKVSVIVPVYNAGESFIPSIHSLFKQTLQSIEIIIVNDASTDNSGSLINHLAKENNNVIPIHFTENKGVHEARLAGLKKSTAPWIGFLDADDFAHPNMFFALLTAALENNADIVVCGSNRVTKDRKFIAPKLQFHHSKKIDSHIFEKFCRFEFGTGMLWNKLYKREIIEPYFNLHFPWRQDINEDLILNIGCFSKANTVFLMKDMLYDYVLSNDSVTSKMEKTWAFVQMYRAFALAVSKFKDLDKVYNIIDMYRIQLSWNTYVIDDTKNLTSYTQKIEEAIELITNTYPKALALLSARKETMPLSIKQAIKALYARILTKFGFKL